MNPSPDQGTEALRSDIDVTRRRMDDTIDALGSRMRPRHLLDEFLGFLRRSDHNGSSNISNMREKVSQGADTAMHAVADTIKKNPMPAALIGAGIAWMIYESRRNRSDDEMYEMEYVAGIQYDPDVHIDRPLDYPGGTAVSEAGWSDQGGSKLGNMKEKLGERAAGAKEKLSRASETARQKMGGLGQSASEKLEAARHRATEMSARVKERTGAAYSRTRQRVAQTSEQHPLELGLVCLAAGFIAGLALPTSRAVNRTLGPAADRLRDRARERGREMLEKGRHVAGAAVSAVKEEAESQGLTPDRLRESVASVADRAKNAGKETARQEGLAPGEGERQTGTSPEGNQSGSQMNDPTVARPAV